MNHLRNCSFGIVFLLAATFARGVEDAPPPNKAEVYEILQQLKELREGAVKTGLSTLLGKVRSAASSPSSALDFYLEAYRVVKFEGITKEQSSYREWQERNEDKLRDNDYRTGLVLHLHYLALTIRRAGGEENIDLLPDLLQYTSTLHDRMTAGMNSQRVVAASKDRQREEQREKKYAMEWLKQSVNASVIADRYGLKPWLKDVKDWEMNPGNYEGIFEQVILPAWREESNPSVITYWDDKIRMEQEKVLNTKLNIRIKKFEDVQLPLLLWKRASEFGNINQPNRALQEMFAIAKKYPSHPAFDSWVKTIEEMVSDPEPEVVQSTDPA